MNASPAPLIPLDEKQTTKFKRWLISLPEPKSYPEETFCPESPFTWHLRDMCIITIVWVTVEYDGQSFKCDLTLDDDNELCEP